MCISQLQMFLPSLYVLHLNSLARNALEFYLSQKVITYGVITEPDLIPGVDQK